MNDTNGSVDLERESARAGCSVDELIERATMHRDTQADPRYQRPSLDRRIEAAVGLYRDRKHVMGLVEDFVLAGFHLLRAEAIRQTREPALA